jgi:hypothetical protein
MSTFVCFGAKLDIVNTFFGLVVAPPDLLTHHGMNQPQHTDRILSLRVGEFVVLDYSISVCRIE